MTTSNTISAMLQPERGSGESFEAYKSRRRSAHDYVASTKVGELIWNPSFQDTYENKTKTRIGKKLSKRLKAARRFAHGNTRSLEAQ